MKFENIIVSEISPLYPNQIDPDDEPQQPEAIVLWGCDG
jgi:hypothetical protein